MGTMLIIGMGPKKGPKHMNPMENYLSKGAGKESLQEVESMGEAGRISFSMPSGFKVPDGVKDGDPFDAMATLMVKDGKLVLSELDGAPVSDEPEMEAPEAEEAPESESEMPESEPASEESEEYSDEAPESEESDEAEDEEDESLDFLSSVEKKAAKKKKM